MAVAQAEGREGARVTAAAKLSGRVGQWDTSEHDWLEGAGEKLYLMHMIDNATSELTARFVRHDSAITNSVPTVSIGRL
jgi:hypothetical protein